MIEALKKSSPPADQWSSRGAALQHARIRRACDRVGLRHDDGVGRVAAPRRGGRRRASQNSGSLSARSARSPRREFIDAASPDCGKAASAGLL